MNYYYLEKTYIYIGFDYNTDILRDLKTMNGFFYNPQNNEWYKEISLESGKPLEFFFKKYGFVKKRPEQKIVNIRIDTAKMNEIISIQTLRKIISDFGFKRTPREYQIEGIHYMINHPNCINGCDMGLGKAQPIDMEIITPDGLRKFGDLKVGDKIFGSDGDVQFIENIYYQGLKDCYEVIFTDNSRAECCDEHLWSVFHNNRSQVRSLRDILNLGLRVKPQIVKNKRGHISNHANRKWRIPLIAEPVKFPARKVHIDPYTLGVLLGVLLGDGCVRKSTPSISTGDDEILSYLILPKTCHIKKSQNKYDYNIISSNWRNELSDLLKKYNLAGKYSFEKEIPEDYIYNSVEIRLALLQGLLDADGYVSKTGLIELALTSKKMIEQVGFLVKSLGGTTNQLRTRKSQYFNSNGQKIECLDHYRIGINPPKTLIPFRLKRKRDLVQNSKKLPPRRYIKQINFLGKKEMQCIKVSNEDQLYVCNQDFILTHNTSQALILAEILELFPCLIITPASVKYGWKAEWYKWVDQNKRKIQVIESTDEWLPGQDVYIINYDILARRKAKDEKNAMLRFPELTTTPWEVVICDEAHFCKNGKSIRSKMVSKIVKHISLFYLLSGTIIPNKPSELITPLEMTGWFKKLFHNWQDYVYRYCNAKKRMLRGQLYGWDITCASNTLELNQIISNACYFRKEKREVLKELPPMIEQVIEIGCSNWKEYRKAEEDLLDYLSKTDESKIEGAENAPHLVKLSVLKNLSLKGKMSGIEVFLTEWKEITHEKLLIFGVRREPLQQLAAKYKCPIIQGGVSSEKKHEIVQSFKDSEAQFLFANIDSIGTGVDGLQECCSNIAYIELPDKFTSLDQANSRLERMGQKNTINIFYLLCPNTIDKYIAEMVENKKRVTNAVNRGILVDVSKIDINYMLVRRLKESR